MKCVRSMEKSNSHGLITIMEKALHVDEKFRMRVDGDINLVIPKKS